jgi:hypothetical protein
MPEKHTPTLSGDAHYKNDLYVYVSATEIVDVDARRPHIHNRTSGLLSFVCAPNCNIRRPKSILTTMQHR